MFLVDSFFNPDVSFKPQDLITLRIVIIGGVSLEQHVPSTFLSR